MRSVAAALLATACVGCSFGSRGDLESPDPARRAAAVLRLGASSDPGDLAPLLVAQQDPDPRVRRAAAEAFGSRGGETSLDGLAPMLGDPDPAVVARAARALGALRPDRRGADARATSDLQRRAGAALTAAYGRADSTGRAEIASALQVIGGSLRDAVEAEARWLWNRNLRALQGKGSAGRPGAAEELGRSGRADADRILLPILEDAGDDPPLLAASARGLGWSTDPAVMEPLEGLLKSRWADVVEGAAWSLGNVGDVRAAEALADLGSTAPARVAQAATAALDALPPAPETGVGLCEVAVRAGDPSVAERAAEGARSREADCPERPLAQRIARGGPESLAALAAFGALGLHGERLKVPGDKAVSLVQSSTDSRVRAAAARALGRAGYPPAVPALQKRAATAAGEELGEVAVALARLAPEAAVPVATRLAGDPDPRLRASAARALGFARPANAVDLLAPLSRDPAVEVRAEAFRALGMLGTAGVPTLAAAVAARPEGDDVAPLARALGATGDPAALPLLGRLLEGPDPSAAAAALGRMAKVEAAPALIAALRADRPAGRVEVVEALGLLGSPDAGEPLAAELTSDRPEVRAAAARALGRLRYEAAAVRLEALRADYYADVRRAAVEALARLPSRAPARH